MHIVYIETRDEDGRLHQSIMRARWIDAWRSEEEVDRMVVNLQLPHGSHYTNYITALRVEPEAEGVSNTSVDREGL